VRPQFIFEFAIRHFLTKEPANSRHKLKKPGNHGYF